MEPVAARPGHHNLMYISEDAGKTWKEFSTGEYHYDYIIPSPLNYGRFLALDHKGEGRHTLHVCTGVFSTSQLSCVLAHSKVGKAQVSSCTVAALRTLPCAALRTLLCAALRTLLCAALHTAPCTPQICRVRTAKWERNRWLFAGIVRASTWRGFCVNLPASHACSL